MMHVVVLGKTVTPDSTILAAENQETGLRDTLTTWFGAPTAT